MKIYFAGSIRGGRDDARIYNEIIQYLTNFGELLTEHVGCKDIGSKGESDKSDQFIFKRDLNWLTTADVVIAEVSTPSLGVGYEIAVAEATGKPVLCLCRTDVIVSAMISGNSYLCLRRYNTFKEIVLHIDSFLRKQTS